MGVNPEFWADKRVLVTGHTGFKGAWLSLWLQKIKAHVVGYSLTPPTQPNLYDLAQVESTTTSIHGDVRDLAHLTRVLEEHRPEIVIHMAAQSLVRYSYQDPVETYHTNVIGTVHVLEAARRCHSVQAVMVVTSDKCYESREWLWPYRESDNLGGCDPYSSSKACAELVTAAYRQSFFRSENGSDSIPTVATVRAGNVIGGGDWARDRLVPDCIRAFVNCRPVLLRYPKAVRPWQHVLDPLAGYLMLAQRLMGPGNNAFCEAWNFGPDASDSATVLDVARQAGKLWGDGQVKVAEDATAPSESGILRLDPTKAVTRVGWRPRWNLTRALQETVGWYRAWHSGADMRAYTLQQISTYESEAGHNVQSF